MGTDSEFGVAQIKIEYSEGFEKRIFQDAEGKAIANNNGVYSLRLKIDNNGNPISLFNYDGEGNITADNNNEEGRGIKSIRINKKGNVIE